MTNTSRLLIAYTTATERRPIYRRDALNAVALPAGWTISLSYRTKWIAPDLVGLLEKNELAGSELLLVVLRGESVGGHPEHAAPLRYCKVLKTELSGQDLALVHIETARRPSKYLVEHFLEQAPKNNWPTPIWRADAKASYYLLAAPKEPGHRAGETSFDSHVEALKSCIEPGNSRYFMITRIYRIKPSNALTPPAVPISLALRQPKASELTMLELRPGSLYNLEVLVHGDSLEGGASPLELKIRGEQVDIAEPLLRQHGSGAMVSYLIAVKRQYAFELATLVIRMRPLHGVPQRPSAEAQVLLHITPTLRFWLTIYVMVVVGTVGLEINKEFVDLLDSSTTAACIVMSAKVAGTALLAWAAWRLFRSVPIKPG
jgi:hypothetical protein